MKMVIRVKINKFKSGVEKLGANEYVVYTKMPAKENKANKDIIHQLAEYFKVPKLRINLLLGKTSKEKVFEIED